ncbi:MAG: type II toxin-antitoxin system RelE/ParE family toxin [Candidatus Paceibacterota bacterium]
MYRILFTAKSIKSLKKLPKSIQAKTDLLVDILIIDYRDNRLKAKKLNTNQSLFSFRVTKDYRVVFMFANSSTIKVLDIKHRKDIYKKLK